MGRRDLRTDAELLVATATDPEAFGVFYARHVKAVYCFFRRHAVGPEGALDLTAETFAAALEGSSRYVPRPTPASGWLFGIAWNKLHEAHRRGQADDRARLELGMRPILLTDEGIERMERLAAPTFALASLAALPQEQRAAVHARIIEDRSYDEIAATLKCSPSVARQRVSRGLRAMRSKLNAPSADG